MERIHLLNLQPRCVCVAHTTRLKRCFAIRLLNLCARTGVKTDPDGDCKVKLQRGAGIKLKEKSKVAGDAGTKVALS